MGYGLSTPLAIGERSHVGLSRLQIVVASATLLLGSGNQMSMARSPLSVCMFGNRSMAATWWANICDCQKLDLTTTYNLLKSN